MLFASHSVSVFVPSESHISTNTLGGKKVLKHKRCIPYFFLDKLALFSVLFFAYFLTSMGLGVHREFDKYVLVSSWNKCVLIDLLKTIFYIEIYVLG